VSKWSTDQVEPKHRFDHWREVRAKGLFGLTVELEPERRPQFSGEFSLRKIGTASLIELRASPYQVKRSTADIARAKANSPTSPAATPARAWCATLGEAAIPGVAKISHAGTIA
jgi:hypothetical protein